MIGWHAKRMRRVVLLGVLGAVAFLVSWPFVGWQLAALIGWDLAAAVFLGVSWDIIMRSDAARTKALAMREDETRRTAATIVIGASITSLLAVAYALADADQHHGVNRTTYIVGALLTVVLSWSVVNTLYTLRYADEHYRHHAGVGVDFGGVEADEENADYRDFAYLAFTIGMCYQVSDQTIRTRHIRRTVLAHSLVSYIFGVVIIASTINAVAGLLNSG